MNFRTAKKKIRETTMFVSRRMQLAIIRFIDIFKPLGCRWIDHNIKGGWGVMQDDVLAIFYALLLLLAGKSLFL